MKDLSEIEKIIPIVFQNLLYRGLDAENWPKEEYQTFSNVKFQETMFLLINESNFNQDFSATHIKIHDSSNSDRSYITTISCNFLHLAIALKRFDQVKKLIEVHKLKILEPIQVKHTIKITYSRDITDMEGNSMPPSESEESDSLTSIELATKLGSTAIAAYLNERAAGNQDKGSPAFTETLSTASTSSSHSVSSSALNSSSVIHAENTDSATADASLVQNMGGLSLDSTASLVLSEAAARAIERLEQQKSKAFTLLFFSQTFDLFRGARDPVKVCDLSEKKDEQGLTLHQRQSLAERLIDHKTNKLEIVTIDRPWPKYVLAIANFGVIVSDRRPQKEADGHSHHHRNFLSVPIKVKDDSITKLLGTKIHAEEALISSLSDQNNIIQLIQKIKSLLSDDPEGYKIYGVILDLHATYDMCFNCCKKLSAFLPEFKKLVHNTCLVLDFTCSVIEKYSCVFRYSSDLPYYESNARKKVSDKEKSVRAEFFKAEGYPLSGEDRDIKQSNMINPREMIIHGRKNWHQLWSDPESLFPNGTPQFLRLENWTAFASSAYSISDPQFDHTKLQAVDASLVVSSIAGPSRSASGART